MEHTKSVEVYLEEGCGRCSKHGTPACTAMRWNTELRHLRRLMLEVFAEETMKWGVPCYTLANKNVALIHGFKDYVAVLFMKGALLSDPEKKLIQQTESVQAGRQLRFLNDSEISAQEALIKAYAFEALELEKAGVKVPLKAPVAQETPPELTAQFEKDPSFLAAFEALTPGRQKNYLRHFNEAKQSATKTARIEKYKPFIFKGMGMEDAWKSTKL
ncbi:MAG: hypothetical protein RLZZ301_807 [Bacteroidota bacterium]|jgi:uncharacterized protein YdeI (YjbR/CyaY-like superfamily)